MQHEPGTEAGEEAAAALSVIGGDLLFVSPVWAHDLGNALHAAGLQLEVLALLLDRTSADTDAAIMALQQQLERVHRLMSVWVDLTCPTAPRAPDFDLGQILDDLSSLLSVTLRQRSATLRLGRADRELMITADRFRLLHASLCLFIRALASMPTGGGAVLSVIDLNGRTARCLIATHAAGDDAALAPEFSLSEPVTDRTDGTLEPSVAFALCTIERHGGLLRRLVVPGRVMAFWFELPLAGCAGPERDPAAFGGDAPMLDDKVSGNHGAGRAPNLMRHRRKQK